MTIPRKTVQTSSLFDGGYVATESPVIVKEFPWHQVELVAPDVLLESGITSEQNVFRVWYTASPVENFLTTFVGYAEVPRP